LVRILVARVILDSNFLFIPSRFQLDIVEELAKLLDQRVDLVVLSPTYEEIARIATSRAPKMRKQASLALKLAEKCHVIPAKQRERESNDDVIVRVAHKWQCPVATNDRELRTRLRDINVSVIYVRQKSRLEIEGNIH
jgi:rRNA-processing protein FCF1